MAAPGWCAKYISELGLADVQTTHAALKIDSPFVSVRVNAGILTTRAGENETKTGGSYPTWTFGR